MSVVVCSEPFVGLAKAQARVFGVPDLPLLVIPHPLGGLRLEDVQKRAEHALTQFLALMEKSAS